MVIEPHGAEALRDEVHKLRLAIEIVADAMDEKVDASVAASVAAKTVPRKELDRRIRASGKRTVAGMVLLLVIILLAVGANRLTLQQAQDQAAQDLATLIQTCRTTAPVLPPKDMAYCQQRIPGFAQARANVARTAATTQRNERRLRHLEDEVAKLKE